MASHGEDGPPTRGRRGRGRGRGYRGRGRGRQSNSDWYVHDDRGNDQDYQDDYGGGVQEYQNLQVTVDPHGNRRVAPPPPPPPSGGGGGSSSNGHRTNSSSMTVPEGWQYRDPEGAEHGPFLAAKIVAWVDKGFFSGGLEVRKVTRLGSGAWTRLEFVLADVHREAALTVIPTSPPVTHSAPPPRPPPPHTSSPSYPDAYVDRGRGRGRGPRGGGRGGPGGRGAPPPQDYRDSQYSYSPRSPALYEESYERGPGGYQGERGGGRGGGRGGRGRGRGGGGEEDSFEYVPRGGRRGGRGERGGGRGDRGGRGERGGRRGGGRFGGPGGRGAPPTQAELDMAAAVHKLFTGEVQQGAEQPMWRYIDYEGIMQGPFPAASMEEWHEAKYLADPAIRVCGTERKVSPPNLPPPDFFIPLGALIYWVRRGHKFTPITVADIQSGSLPEELQVLKDGAQKAVAPTAAAAAAAAAGAAPEESAGSAAGSQTGDKGEEDVGDAADEGEESLAAAISRLAVSKAVEEHGE